MKNKKDFIIIADGISDTNEAPKGKNIYYKCMICGETIPSQPRDNIGCECGNIFIDIDYFRLWIKDYSRAQVLKNL